MIKKVLLIIISLILFVPLTYSDYQANIDDEVKLYNFTRDILLRLEKYKNTEALQNRIQNKMLELSGGSKEDFGRYYNKLQKKYSSFREYGIEYIYHHIIHDINEYYISGEGKILENSFARIFVNTSDIYMTEKEVFLKYDDGHKWKMIEFFKTDKSIEDYINNNILEKEFHGKCKAVKNDTKGNMFTKNQTYYIEGFGDYKGAFREPGDCGSNGDGFFEKRGDYIIYINAGQDFNGLYFRFIDIK